MVRRYYRKSHKKNIIITFIGVLFVMFGVDIFLAAYPPLIALQFYLMHPQLNRDSRMTSPVPLSWNDARELSSDILSSYNARSWYPGVPGDVGKIRTVSSYFLSIPKLNILNAVVSTTDYNLSNHLIQYFGTSLPGQDGTAIIFGHSSLPALFSPHNYRTIFATVHTLKDGDEIDATIGGITYPYRIVSIVVAAASDTSIFSQTKNDSYLTLVTCFPPGTIWKRLIVRAKLNAE